MANELDVRIEELKLEQAIQEVEKSKIDAGEKKQNSFLNYVIGGLIGAVVTLAGAYLNFHNKDREIDLELARLSLNILSGEYEPGDKNSLPARMFALNALERGTGVLIPYDDKQTWAKTGLTPVSDIFTGIKVSAGPAETLLQEIRLRTRRTQLIETGRWEQSPEVCIEASFFAPRICGQYIEYDEDQKEACIFVAHETPDPGYEKFVTGDVGCGSLIDIDRSDLPW